MALRQLPLSEMSKRHPGLTQAIAANYFEAAGVCLDRHHASPTTFVLKSASEALYALVTWNEVDHRVRSAWANETDTTRDGAYACALAAVELLFDLVAVRRAETLTGADYYIGSFNQSPDDLEDCWRLEVSGIDRGNAADIGRRLRLKAAQAAMGYSSLPAMACVVGFQAAIIALERVEMS
jgi:hypothetical protein